MGNVEQLDTMAGHDMTDEQTFDSLFAVKVMSNVTLYEYSR